MESLCDEVALDQVPIMPTHLLPAGTLLHGQVIVRNEEKRISEERRSGLVV